MKDGDILIIQLNYASFLEAVRRALVYRQLSMIADTTEYTGDWIYWKAFADTSRN